MVEHKNSNNDSRSYNKSGDSNRSYSSSDDKSYNSNQSGNRDLKSGGDNSGFSENYNPNEHMRQGHHTLDEIKNDENFEITNMHKTKTGNNVVTVANYETNEIQTFPSVKSENLEGISGLEEQQQNLNQ